MNEAEINRHGTPHDLMLRYSQHLPQVSIGLLKHMVRYI